MDKSFGDLAKSFALVANEMQLWNTTWRNVVKFEDGVVWLKITPKQLSEETLNRLKEYGWEIYNNMLLNTGDTF